VESKVAGVSAEDDKVGKGEADECEGPSVIGHDVQSAVTSMDERSNQSRRAQKRKQDLSP